MLPLKLITFYLKELHTNSMPKKAEKNVHQRGCAASPENIQFYNLLYYLIFKYLLMALKVHYEHSKFLLQSPSSNHKSGRLKTKD